MNVLTVIAIFAFLFTLFVLGRGIWSMAHGGQHDREESNGFMRARVAWQFVALVAVLLAVALGLQR
jgi:Hypoxia induced protein conserved region